MADDIRRCADLEERLTPYVDGEASQAEREQVDGHLATCGTCCAGAEAESAARDLVREHRSALAGKAPEALRARCASSFQLSASGSQLPAADSQLSASSNPRTVLPPPTFAEATVGKPPSAPRRAMRRWVPLSLAATLVLAVAGVFLFGLNDKVEALAASLAIDHVKCFKVSGTATAADAHAAERAWEQRQGWSIALPPTDAAQQLTLVDVRRCFTTDGRAAHAMYTWRGEPLSVYVLQGDTGRDRLVHKMGAQVIVWGANQRIYAVVSSDASRDLTPIVEYMKARVR
jgi:anti-sigma factor (TIGR02949 family)